MIKKTLHLHSFRKLNRFGFDHVLLSVAFVVVIALVGTAMVVATHAATPQWSGVLKVYSGNATVGAGYCLTTTVDSNGSGGSGGSEGSYAVLEPCSKTYAADQVWDLNDYKTASAFGVSNVQLFNLQSGAGNSECLNDWQSSKTNGTQMRLYPCSETNANLWAWGVKFTSEGYSSHEMANVGSGTSATSAHLCLDDSGGSDKAGTKVDIYTCKKSNQSPSNEEWFEEPAPSKTSAPTPSGAGTVTWTGALRNDNNSAKICMNDNGSSTSSGKPIGIYACENVVSEKWSVVESSTSGEFELKNGQGVCADEGGSGTTEPLQTNTCSSSDLFKWDGHELQDVSTSDCINDPSSSTKNGTQLTVTTCSNADSEQWSEVGL